VARYRPGSFSINTIRSNSCFSRVHGKAIGLNRGWKTGYKTNSKVIKDTANKRMQNLWDENIQQANNVLKDSNLNDIHKAMLGGKMRNVFKKEGVPYSYKKVPSTDLNGNPTEGVRMSYLVNNKLGAKYQKDIMVNPFKTEEYIKGVDDIGPMTYGR
jgi:hypothetical protein